MDAIKFLLKEHQKIRKTFTKISKKSHSYPTKKTMFKPLSQFLVRHESMEQKVWYPRLKTNKKLKTRVKHLLTEEKTAAKAIKKLKSIKKPEQWEKKYVELKRDVEHHAREEERKLFPNVRKLVDKPTLVAIGKKMRSYKAKHKKS